jgi:hypothetical protein
MNTAGWVTQGKPNTDLQIFISPIAAIPFNNTLTTPISFGNPSQSITFPLSGLVVDEEHAGTYAISYQISDLLQRLGMLQSTNFALNSSQEAFGTASGPGPSAIAGTSGPSGFGPDSVIPPVMGANLPTLIGSVAGPPKKGIQINWIDLIYQVAGDPLTSLSYVVNKITIPPGIDQTLTEITLVSGVVPAGAKLENINDFTRFRVINPNPEMLIDDMDILNIFLTASVLNATSFSSMGLILGCSYNFN